MKLPDWKLGQNIIGTMNEFLKHSSTKEHPGKYVSAKDSIRELLEDHETVIIELRTGFDDCVED